MAENTPPSILRDRLRKTKEINDFLENELTEICEFTMYEKQLLLVEKGCSELEVQNRRLSDEIENLTKVVRSRDDILNGVRNKIEEKKIRFSSLKDEASLLTAESSNEGVLTPSALISEVLSTFESLSKYIGNDSIPYEARRRSSIGNDDDRVNITGEEVQNEVSKLRQILETSVEVEARRLSDSILIQEKLKSKASLFSSKEVAIQTGHDDSAKLIWPTPSSSVNLLDISNFNGMNDVDGKRADNLMLSSNVEELERKMLEINERCQDLSSANEDLEKLLNYREGEIQKLTERLNTPKSPCSCNKSTLDHDLEYKDMTLSCSVLPVIDSFQANMSLVNNSFLPTIQEVKESSFEGSFDENNVPDFTSPPSDIHGVVGEVDSEMALGVSLGQGDRALLEKYRTELADLQKCRNLLANELEYCLSELDERDEQITLLQSTLPVAFNLCAGITASSDLFKRCNEEIESLEILVDESEGSVNNELNAEVTGRLVNVLNIIQKGVDTMFNVSMYPSTDPRSTESSFADMSTLTLSNMSSYPQQFCSVVLDSSVPVGANDSSMINPAVAANKPDTILKDVRNLRQSMELITSDFSREFFNITSKLDRVESIILWFRNMDSDDPVSSADSTKPSKPPSLTTYKSVLIEDIREKARLILDLHKSRSDKRCKDSIQGVSAQSSDESLTKTYDQHNRETGSVISTTDSSVYGSATDGDEAHLHFMCRTDSKCDVEGQNSFVSSHVTLSTSVSAFEHCTEDSQRYDDTEVNIDQEGYKNVNGAETILSAFWKTVNEFDEALKNLGIPTSKTSILSDNDTITQEKVECYKESVRQLLKLALLREPMFQPCSDEKDSYDPECTRLMSLDITSLNEDSQRKKPLQTSLLNANQNIVNVNEEEKENSFCDSDLALRKAVKNWEKLIHDSNKRIAELVQSKNNVEVKLSEKVADNHNLVQQLNKVQSEIKSHQVGLREKAKIVEDLYALIANKDVQLDNIKSEVSLVQGEATRLKVELKNTKESWNTMVTDFMKQYQDLSVKIDSFQTEIDNLQKDKSELDGQLSSASTTIEELRTELLNKEPLKTSLDIVEEKLTKEIAEKEDLKNIFQELTDKLSSADRKVSDLESEISSLNGNLHEVPDQLSTVEKKADELKGKLTYELTEKEELETNLQQVTDQLFSAQNKVIELEEAIRDKTNLILKLQASEIVQNDHQGRIAHLESSVTTLTKELEDTRASWNTLILSSSSEIDQLKSTLKTVEVHLCTELANKIKLEHSLLDVEQKLFTAHEKVSDLEVEINAMNENLHINELAEKEKLLKNLQDVTSQLFTAENKVTELEEAIRDKNSLMQELQNSKVRENEHQVLITNLEHSVTTVTETLEDTRASWSKLILSSSAEIDQLRSSLKTFEVALSKELANKTKLEHTLRGVEQKLLMAHESLLEKNELRASLDIAEDQLAQKIAEKEELLNNFQDVTGRLSSAEENILDLEKEIASMNESLLENDQLRTSVKMAEEKLASELTEKEDLLNNFRDITDRLSTAEKNVLDLEREVTAMNEKLVNTETAGRVVEEQLAKEMTEKEDLQSSLLNFTGLLSAAENKVVDLERKIVSLNDKSVNEDQLRTSLKIAEEKLTSELAEKEKLQKNLQDVTGQLCTAENKVTELEEAIHDKNSLIQELQNSKIVEDEHHDMIATLEHSVITLTKTLEGTRSRWNDLILSSSAEVDHLKGSVKTVEVQLAKELANKTELENSLHDIGLKLSTSEKRVADREEEIAAVKQTLIEKVNFIQDLQAREIGQSERLSRTEEMVNTLTSALDEAKMGWSDSIKSSSSEIAELKASLKMVEEQLDNEVADKEKLTSYSEGVAEELSMAKKEIADLEHKLSDAHEALAVKKDHIDELEAGVTEIDEYLFQIKKLENSNNDLASSLQLTRESWTNLMKTSRAEIDRLAALNASLSYDLSIESLKCKTLSRVLEDASTNMINAEETIREREAALDDLNIVLLEKDNQISQLNSKYTCLSNNFQTLMLNCKESFRQHDQLLNRIELELATTSLEKENLSNLLEEALCRFEGLKQTLMEKEDNFKSVLAEQEKLFSDKFSAIDHLEGVVADLTGDIMVAQVNRKRLILEAKKRIDEMNTSKKRAEVQMVVEIVERKKVTTELATAILEMENLRGGLQMNQDIIRDMRNSLSTLKNPVYDEQALNRSDNFGDDVIIDPQGARSDLKQVVLGIKERIAGLCEAERSLSLKLEEEKDSNIQLASELHKALSTIAELEEEIEKNRTRPSSVNDIDICRSENSALHSKSIPLDNHSVISRGSLTYEDEFEATTYSAAVHLEQSVFVSDLAMERTLFGDNVDPLSMTMRPELVVTPRKMDTGHESTDTDESEFGTPVANRFWLGENSSDSPRQIRGTEEKTPVDSRRITASVTKNLAHQAAIEENADLQEKLKTNEKDLRTLQSKVEETSAQHNQLSQRIMTIQTLVDGIMKVFYNRVPELPMEQNIVNISTDITKLTEAINKSWRIAHTCLMDSVNTLISEGLPASSFIKDSIADTNSKMQVIAKDCSTLKNEMLQFVDLLAIQLANTSSSISSSVEQNVSSFSLQLAQKNSVIQELKDTNDTIQSTLLAASLEKESLRDELKEEISQNKSLKFRFEEKEKELEAKCDILREECDANVFQRNNIESIILELLRQWNGDEKIISEDVVRELKLVFSEAVHAKNMLKTRTSKAANFEFMKGIEEIMSKNELLEGSLSHLKSQLLRECKTLSAGIKDIQNESKNLFLDFSSFRNEIEGALCRALSAVNDLGEESLRNLSSKEDACVLEEKLKKCQDRIDDYETTINEVSSKCSCLALKVKLLEDDNTSLSSTNEALVRGVSDSDAKNKDLFSKLEEMKASNGILSTEMAKLQETIIGLNEKLRANELQLSACEKQKVQVSDECSVCGTKESELESIKQTLFAVIVSTKGKPIDLSSSRDDVLEKLNYVRSVLSKSNDTLYSVLELLNSQEMSGVIALEHLYRQLKSNDVRDAYLCKKKIANEIHSMDSEMRVEELVQLSLLELQSKLVSVIMEKEAVLIANFQNDYESKLASKVHQLSQYEEREKYMREMIDDLTKENEKLEENVSKSKSQNVREDSGTGMVKDTSIAHLESTINQEENKMLTAEIETLNDQISSLKDGAAEAASKVKVMVSDLEEILMNFLELLNVEESVPSQYIQNIEFNLENVGFPNQLSSIMQGMFSRLSDMKNLFVSTAKHSKENVLIVERLKDVENQHEKCKDVVLQMEELCKELEAKEELLSKLNEDHVTLQTQLNDIKRSITSKDNEVVSTLTSEKVNLEVELGHSKRRIEELNSCQVAFSTKSQNLKEKVRTISNHLGSIKSEFLTFQNETLTENKKILNYFQNLSKQLNGLVEDEKNKVRVFETEVIHLRGQSSALNVENSKLANKIRDLETSLANEFAEKQSLNERLKKLEDTPARTGHEDKTCPYKEKVQELKKELWIIRQKTGEEQKNFNVMKKNIEEDLAFKAAVIKKLEERNEATVTQFNLRLASSTTSYNQVCKKLEEAEEKISFLRDMNSQDKKRLEKDIDNLRKEISRLHFAKTFSEGLGIDCDKLQESLPEIKKKLSEYENLQTALSEMTDKNKELEEECDFMNKQIEFLELRNAEMFKQNMEVTEQLETLKKELSDNVELAHKSKQLQEGIDAMKVSESKYIAALDASQLQLNQSLQRLSELELKNNQLQNAYKLLESNLESRNQKILHYVSEMKNYESMLMEKTKMNQEVGVALAEERSKYADLSLQKSSVEKNLASLQNELRECHARLKDLGSRLDTAASVENDLRKVSAERDNVIRSYGELKSKQATSQQVIREKESLIQSLRSTHDTLVAEKKENEDILRARERELIAKIDNLKTDASNNAVKIVQLESLLETSQPVQVEAYKNKISSLEIEVETLKKELSRSTTLTSPRPQHVTVEAASLSNKVDTKTRGEFEHAINKLEKKQTVLKRLCQQRREKILEMEDLLRHHGIRVPSRTDQSQ